jgi:VWFA-related protein
MMRFTCLLLLAYAGGGALAPSSGDSQVVFRSDVSLVRVDAQVVDRVNRAITDLRVDDFVLHEGGRLQPIRNFASEDMPVDILFLLDVSASMGPHVQRIADASRQALMVLGTSDRMGIMVFDRSTRVRLRFSGSRLELQRELDHLLRQERFNGGTDITRAMLDAADYIRREGRRDARRAIVILTDDQTEFDRNEAEVSLALARADAVMCALIAPDALQFGHFPGGVRQRRGGFGNPVAGTGGFLVSVHTRSAGTAQIARNSGGDAMSVDKASALEETLLRLRQRYTLYFSLPEGVRPGQERNIEVGLTDRTRLRFPDADVRYRRVYMTPTGGAEATPTSVVEEPADRGDNASSSWHANIDAGLHRAPSSETNDIRSKQKYQFTGSTPVSEARAIDPIVLEMQGFQDILSSVLRKAYFAGSAGLATTSGIRASGDHGYPMSSASSTDGTAGKSPPQPSKPRASWLMQNYRFTGPPPASELREIDPVVFELRQIQNTVLAILRKTDFAKDYEAALAAAAQATANAQLIGSLTERQHPLTTEKTDTTALEPTSPIYLIALKDKTIDAATSYWVEGFVLNYITLQGAHVIVRLDLVDRSFSRKLNRQRGLEFRVPDTNQ